MTRARPSGGSWKLKDQIALGRERLAQLLNHFADVDQDSRSPR
jgi:hypothetical protein